MRNGTGGHAVLALETLINSSREDPLVFKTINLMLLALANF